MGPRLFTLNCRQFVTQWDLHFVSIPTPYPQTGKGISKLLRLERINFHVTMTVSGYHHSTIILRLS